MIFSKKKYCIYTAIFGGKDELKEVPYPEKNVDYICFTDQEKNFSTWEIVTVPLLFENPRMSAKIFKILPHLFVRNYEYTLWIDGAFELKDFKFKNLVGKHLNDSGLALCIHPERNCIYDEANVCISRNLDNEERIHKQIERYKEEGYPSNNGLSACGFLLRRTNDPKVVTFDNMWWKEIISGSSRDQLSFNYVAWKLKYGFETINQSYWDNEYVKWINHLK